MTYTNEDARFDAEAQGRCGICGREDCGHCSECGRVKCTCGDEQIPTIEEEIEAELQAVAKRARVVVRQWAALTDLRVATFRDGLPTTGLDTRLRQFGHTVDALRKALS